MAGFNVRFVLCALFILSPSLAMSKPDFGSVDVSDVISIYDADTFRVNVSGWPAVIGKNMSIRVNGVDAPEIRGKCPSEKKAAREARLFTVRFLQAGKIELHNLKRGKYFRLLADVVVNGKSLTTALIKSGHARPYSGGKRAGWCGPSFKPQVSSL